MWPALGRWTDIEFRDWQVIDLAGAAEHADLCEAALSYLLERMRLEIEDPAETTRLKLTVVDEDVHPVHWHMSPRGGQPTLAETRNACLPTAEFHHRHASSTMTPNLQQSTKKGEEPEKLHGFLSADRENRIAGLSVQAWKDPTARPTAVVWRS